MSLKLKQSIKHLSFIRNMFSGSIVNYLINDIKHFFLGPGSKVDQVGVLDSGGRGAIGFAVVGGEPDGQVRDETDRQRKPGQRRRRRIGRRYRNDR